MVDPLSAPAQEAPPPPTSPSTPAPGRFIRPCHRPDPGRLITGGDGNTTARPMAIRNTRALTEYPVTVVPVPGGVDVMFVRRNP
jgi:hypothetical protein